MALATYTINGGTMAWPVFAPWVPLISDDIIFNGFGLQNDLILTDQPNFDDVGSVDLITYNKPRLDGGGILGHYYRNKTLVFKWTITRSTGEELNDFLDYFKQQVNTSEGNLDIKVNDTYRRTEASLVSLSFNRKHYNIDWTPYTLTLRTVNPFFYETVLNSDEFPNKTSSPIVGEVKNDGSAITFPKLQFVFAGSGNSNVTEITFTAEDTSIIVINTFSNSDILTINCDTKTVLLNDVAIDYDGVFPSFAIGTNSFSVAVTAIAFVLDLTVIYKTNYI